MSVVDTLNSLDERISAAIADGLLAPSERGVARFLVEHAEELPLMSTSQIAKGADVGLATVMRTTKALGYSGLAELKQEAQDLLRARARPMNRVAHGLEELGSDPAAMLDQLLAFQISVLTDARKTLNAQDFGRAVELIRKAKRVVVLASGAHRAPAEYFSRDLRILGRSGVFIGGFGHSFAADVMDLRKGDLLLVVAYDVVTREVIVTLEHAHTLQIPRVLITDTLGIALRDRCDVILSAKRGDPAGMPTAVITTAVMEALSRAFAASQPADTIKAQKKFDELRGKLD